jgi:hypothetical protein
MRRRFPLFALSVLLATVMFAGSSCFLLPLLIEPEPTTTPTPAPTSRPVPPSPVPTTRPAPTLPAPTVTTGAIITGRIDTGASTNLAGRAIDTAGGTLTVAVASSPLNGMTLTIPPSTYPAAKTYRISSAPITGVTFRNVTPITPLITIDNGGQYSSVPMTVKIPIQVPAGQFAMGFYYDRQKGRLEGIPAVAVEPGSITLATCHFCELLISAIPEGALEGDCDSRFRAANDEWQIPNQQMAQINGFCAAWTSSALWYYIEKPDGNTPLWNHYEGTMGHSTPGPKKDEDDVKALRMVTSLQLDYEDRGLLPENVIKYFGLLAPKASAQFMAYSILATGAPQLGVVVMRHPNGSEDKHAVIIPRVDKLTPYVIDPNAPGELRRTRWDNGRLIYDFDAARGITGDLVWMAVSAFVSWDQIGKRWAELKESNPGSDRFPAYRIIAYVDDKNGGQVPLYERNGQPMEVSPNWQYPSEYAKVYFKPELTGANPVWLKDPKPKLEAVVTVIQSSTTQGDHLNRYTLTPGAATLIGVNVWLNNWTKYDPGPGPFGRGDGWLDYRYVTVNLKPQLTVTPQTWSGKVGQSVTFVAFDPALPAGATYTWDITLLGSSSNSWWDEINGTDPSYVFKPDKIGTYRIRVKEIDKGGNQLSYADATASVTGPAASFNWTSLRKSTMLYLSAGPGKHTFKDFLVGKNTTTSIVNNGSAYVPGKDDLWSLNQNILKITWNGAAFSGQLSTKDAASGATTTGTLIGRLSDDGQTLLNLSYEQHYSAPHGGNADTNFRSGTLSSISFLQVTNLPLSWKTGGNTQDDPWEFTSTLAGGANIPKYLKITEQLDDTLTTATGGLTPWEWITYQSSEWASDASIFIRFAR